jgi:AcrR family transcriptional regulator
MSAPLQLSHDRVKAGTHKRPLTAAIEVLAEQGFAGATADGIASRAGRTGGAVSLFFLGKTITS